jgi:hypothetical protein
MNSAAPARRWDTLARLIRHPLRTHALFKYAEGVTSPKQVATALQAPLNLVSYHTDVLARAGAIELVRTERRRGATEHFYRAVLVGQIGDEEWGAVPLNLRRALGRAVIDGARLEAVDALAIGGMDGASTHLSRTYLSLDDRGQRALAELLREMLARAADIDSASRERAAADGVPYELVVMGFQRASRP